ncbi:MAG: hypothetical protein ACI4AH_00935 [Muribaculaceae bacterium]
MKRVRVLLMIAFLSVMTLGFSSCDEEDFRYGSVVGVWELESDEYGYVPDIDVDKYAFYPDGTGVYGYYDYRGFWVSDVPFLWSYGWAGDGSICIDFGGADEYYYYYEFDGHNLVLSEDPYFRSWLSYRRVPN